MKPKYKHIKFDNNKEFEQWRLATTDCIIEFQDCGQDFLRWYIAKNGEVIDSQPFHSSLWNGTFVDNVAVGECPTVQKVDDQGNLVLDSTLNYPIKNIIEKVAATA